MVLPLEIFNLTPILPWPLVERGFCMPTYTYRCEQCAHQFDVVQRMSEDPLRDCPACQAAALVKQIQAVGFALKGTGWYVTDFRDKGKALKKPEGEVETKTESKTETKAEPAATPKPEAKPAAASTTE
jgi:putative FmdB family regulatory protein